MQHGIADMILHHGNVITIDGNNRITEAVAVKGGKIVAIGSDSEVMRLRNNGTNVIDLKGRTLIPGFIDAHTHLDLIGMAASDLMVKCYCPPLQNVDEMLAEIKKRADGTPKGELIFAHRRFDQPHPTKEQLDKVAPEHPVIMKDSMHDYTLNSLALRKFKITNEYPSEEELFQIEPGAIIERHPETNEPTGQLFEAWNFLFPYSFSPYPYKETKKFIKMGLDRFSSAGVTSVTEFADFPQTMRAYQDLLSSGDLNVRMQVVTCVHGLHKTTELDAVIQQGLSMGFGNDFLRFMGIKIFVDRGHVTTLASIQLDQMVLKAHKNGLRVYIHAINRAAQDMALRALEAVEQAVPGKNLRHRIEHMGNEFHDPSFLDRIKEIGVIPLPTAYFMRIGSQPWLKAKTSKAFPFKSLLDMGLCVPGNSDSAGTEPEAYSPLYNIWCMVARKSKEGELVSPDERISAMDAIRIYTAHSAYAGFDENVKGSVEPGKMADFAVLAENPLTVPEDDLKDIPVDMTIVDGEVVYQR